MHTDVCSQVAKQQTYLVDEGLERVEGGNEHVEAQVELVAMNQKRVSYVALDHARLTVCHVSQVVYEVDASTSAQAVRLEDPDVQAPLLVRLHAV